MLFGNKISLYECKDYLLTQFKLFDPQIYSETENSLAIKLFCRSRVVTITIQQIAKGKVYLDVDDSYFILRIPRGEFKKFDDYKQAIICVQSKIANDFGAVENP